MATALKRRIPVFEQLLIESQSNCNRSCWFCPRTYDRSGKYFNDAGRSVFEQMPTGKILDLLDQALALGFRGPVGFHHYSEPLLDKRNVMLAEEARRRGMQPHLHTNGDILRRDDELCEAVKKVYQLVVVGLYDYETNAELAEAKQYWRDRLAGANLSFSAIGRSGARSAHTMGIPRALVPSDTRMAIPDLTFANGPCHRPLIRLIVQHDGTVCNCCEDTYGAFDLGNVYQSSIEELWFSEHHVRVVEDLIEGRREKYSLCNNCPLSPTGPPAGGERMQIAVREYSSKAASPLV
jgi:radical SAM protein with 4Fe4S-binding SPASM domain